MPKDASRVELVVPAAQVLLTRARLPDIARRRTGPILAFAVEDETLREPEANRVTWVGSAGDDDVLAVMDEKGLKQCLDAFTAITVSIDEVYCETLLLPWVAGEWSVAWDGREGFVRTGEFEGAAMDCGDETSPPLSLRLMLENREVKPVSIALYTIAPAGTPAVYGTGAGGGTKAGTEATGEGSTGEASTTPDIEAWQSELGIPIRLAGTWDWRTTQIDPSGALLRERKHGKFFFGLLPRLRPAAWIAAAVLVFHSLALVADWALLAREQRTLRQNMETRFRAIFPSAVAVVDPALQMQRKLVEARHAAGLPDNRDFSPMLEAIGPVLHEMAPGSLRAISYSTGKMALELTTEEETLVQRIADRLRQNALSVNASAMSDGRSGGSGSGSLVLNVQIP